MLEFGIVVQHDQRELLSSCRNEKVGHLSAPLTSAREEALHLPRALNVRLGGVDQDEDLEGPL